MDEFSARALRSKDSENEFHSFALAYRNFIRKQASKACGRVITESDDEWSVALIAFHRAVVSYEENKGSFYAFASVVIRRAIIDDYRRNKRHEPEIATEPDTFDGDLDIDEASAYEVEVSKKANESSAENDREQLVEEIDALNEQLTPFGFQLFDVGESSPKAGRTRSACAVAVRALLERDELYRSMTQKNRLPYMELLKIRRISKKTLERYRPYIIATAIIMRGDYPLLAEYAGRI